MTQIANEDLIEFTIQPEDLAFKRLDQLLVHKFPDISRSLIKKYFEEDLFFSPDCTLELKKIPKVGSKIYFEKPIPLDATALPENIALNILYEDEFLLFVNKPAGMVVHPAPGHWSGTLVNAILYHCKDLTGVGNVKRPGIVHRLDIGTSGVMVVAKEQKTHEDLVEIFRAHDLTRKYEALVLKKNFPTAGKIQSIIGRSSTNRLKMSSSTKNGKDAITHYKTLGTSKNLCHMELLLETGRTHQIRVHLSEKLHSPIINDYLYANPKQQMTALSDKMVALLANYEYPLLHARYLKLKHPRTKEILEFEAPAPYPFSEILQLMKEDKE
jgi:23S rRNA pseudouridine1911/1915/1917 synthase